MPLNLRLMSVYDWNDPDHPFMRLARMWLWGGILVLLVMGAARCVSWCQDAQVMHLYAISAQSSETALQRRMAWAFGIYDDPAIKAWFCRRYRQ